LSCVDPETHHRVVRLTSERGSASLYFNQDSDTPDGKWMIYTAPEGIAVLGLN
jgi:oligogalacturonide lyase